jgi:macrolide-specific efflux system membrane fusion protein
MDTSQRPILLTEHAQQTPKVESSTASSERILPPIGKRESLAAFLIGTIVTPVIWALLTYFSHFPLRDAPKPPAPIQTIAAANGNVSKTVRAFGKLAIAHYADVGTQITGQLKEVYVGIGEPVKAGKLLAEITPAPQSERTDSNRAQLARLRAEQSDQSAQAEFARLQYQRQTKLIADSATRAEDVESSRMNMLSSAAKVEAINAQIEQAEASLKEDASIQRQTKVISPITGTVVMLAAHNGQMINANQTTLMRVADLNTMTVQARVAESDVTLLHKGMPASFTTPGLPGRTWTGKLTQIMPLPIDDSAQQGKPTYYEALFDVANPDHVLMSGMNAEVGFLLAQSEHAVTIPPCLLEHPKLSGSQTVLVADAKGKLHERKITVGLINDQSAEVISGLRAGEKVAALDQSIMPDCVRLANGAAEK